MTAQWLPDQRLGGVVAVVGEARLSAWVDGAARWFVFIGQVYVDSGTAESLTAAQEAAENAARRLARGILAGLGDEP